MLRVHKSKNKKKTVSRRLSGEVTLRENAHTHTVIHMHNLHCIQKRKKLNWIESNWFQSNNVISCFLCLRLFRFIDFHFDTLAYLLLLLLINIESLRTFRIEQTNNGTQKYKWHLKRKWTDAWTMYACERTQSNQIVCVWFGTHQKLRWTKTRRRDSSPRWPTYYWFILLLYMMPFVFKLEMYRLLDSKQNKTKRKRRRRTHAHRKVIWSWMHAYIFRRWLFAFFAVVCSYNSNQRMRQSRSEAWARERERENKRLSHCVAQQ